MKTKQAKQILYSLVMAIVMMAMCPMKVWAQEPIQVSTANALISAISGYTTANIQLTQDITFSSELSGGANKKNVTIDLNNHTLSYNGEDDYAFWYFKSLTLKNGTFTSTKGGVGKTTTLNIDNCNISAVKPCIMNNGGTCSLNNVQMTSTSSSAVSTIGGTINFNGPCRLSSSSGNTPPLYNLSDGTINIATDYKMLDYNGTEISDFDGYVGTWGKYITVKKCCVAVKIGETTTKYVDIQTALSAAVNATSPATMTMLDDVKINTLTTIPIKINRNGCDVTLDLNGHSIISSTCAVELTAGKLTIEDNSTEQSGLIKSDVNTIFTSGGSITIHGGTFASKANHALYITETGVTASVDGGIFMSENSSAVRCSSQTTALANGFSFYYNEQELQSATSDITDENGTPAKVVIVKPATVKATLTIDGGTTDYYTFLSAFNAALNSTKLATLKMLADANLGMINNNNALKINADGCKMTIDLNGHRLTNTNGNNIIDLESGALTVTDSSTGEPGEMESKDVTLFVVGGSITIHKGTFISNNSCALFISGSSIESSVDGGTFKGISRYAIYTQYNQKVLENGYSFYNKAGTELITTPYGVNDVNGTDAKEVEVKPATVKATVTINGETTDYYTLPTAMTAAINSTSPAVVKMFANADLEKVNNKLCFEINNSNSNVTFDLNGYEITNSYDKAFLLRSGSLTITDSSADKTGKMETRYTAVFVFGGSITIHGGTFITVREKSLCINDANVVSLVDGGRFVSLNGKAISEPANYNALADGCSYYNNESGAKLSSTTGDIKDENGNDATDVVVLNNTNVTIEDGSTFSCPIDYTVENLTFNRNIVKDGGMYSFIVPFDIPATKAAELGKFYKYEKCEDDVVYFAEETEGVKANTGYFLDPAKNITSITVQSAEIKATATMANAANPSATGLYGAYKTIDIPAGAYGYGADGVFVKAGSGNKLAAYRAYLWLGNDVNLSKATAIFRNGGGLTAIDAIENDVMDSAAPIYNLSGQRIATPKNGEIYIQNGKKIIMK